MIPIDSSWVLISCVYRVSELLLSKCYQPIVITGFINDHNSHHDNKKINLECQLFVLLPTLWPHFRWRSSFHHYLLWYLSKILHNLELFDKYIESYCPDLFAGRKIKVEELGTGKGKSSLQWQNLLLLWQKNNIIKIWEGTFKSSNNQQPKERRRTRCR